MKYILFLTLTTIIIFFIYLGMAYITTMPTANENVETNDSIEIFDIKPIQKNQFQSKKTKNPINIEPKKSNFDALKIQQYFDFNEQQTQNKNQIDTRHINSHIPADFSIEPKESINNSDLASIMDRPMYPYEAYRNNINGWVLLKLFITKTGSVENVVVLDSNPTGIFENIAVKTAYKKVFTINKSVLDPKKYTKNIKIEYKAGDQLL